MLHLIKFQLVGFQGTDFTVLSTGGGANLSTSFSRGYALIANVSFKQLSPPYLFKLKEVDFREL
jgi:hypothetical protein